ARLLEGARFVHAVGERQRLAVVGDGDVLVSESARRGGHGFDRVLAVSGRGMHLQIAAKVAQLDEVWKLVLRGGLDFTAVLAQLRRNEVETELRVDFF